MTKNKTLTRKVREQYGDSVEQFAQRLNTAPATVNGWEAGQEPQGVARALLAYAEQYPLALYPNIREEFAKLSIREQLRALMQNFGDNQKSFAMRIGLAGYNMREWLRHDTISPIAQRYIFEVAMYPERFQPTLKSYADKSASQEN